jgi:hypothetical protein
MLASVYDPQGKRTDVYKYVDEAIGKIPTPDVSAQIKAHNESETAHPDIRAKIPTKTSQLTNDSGYLTQHQDISGKLDKTGDGSNVTAAFTAAETRTNIATGEKLSILLGKIAKWLGDLKALAFKDKVAKTDLASDVQASLGKADSALQSSVVGVASGVASLGADGKVPSSQLPAQSRKLKPKFVRGTNLPGSISSWGSGAYKVVFDGTKFVGIVCNSTANNVSAQSVDGLNWTPVELSISGAWSNLAYGNGVFVLLGRSLTQDFAYSTDGVNFTLGTLPSKQWWYGPRFCHDRFFIYHDKEGAYSFDGINWTTFTITKDNAQVDLSTRIAYGNDLYVMAGSAGQIFYSTDGATWKYATTLSRYPDNNQAMSDVLFCDDVFVILPSNNGDIIAYSTDGKYWTYGQTADHKSNWVGLYADGRVLMVDGSSRYAAYSDDGIYWGVFVLPTNVGAGSLAYGNGRYIITHTTAPWIYHT